MFPCTSSLNTTTNLVRVRLSVKDGAKAMSGSRKSFNYPQSTDHKHEDQQLSLLTLEEIPSDQYEKSRRFLNTD